MIADGKNVKIDYTLTVDGAVVDTSKGKDPLAYTHGQGMLIKGLEVELSGMKTGDAKQVTIAPADGYGDHTPEAIQEVPLSQFPENMKPEVGMQLGIQTESGEQMPVRIAEIKKETAILDLNHPLAGKELNFDVKIVSVD